MPPSTATKGAAVAASKVRQTEVCSVNEIRASAGEEEWAARVDLAACYRLVALYGMTDLIYNHISAQVPGQTTNI